MEGISGNHFVAKKYDNELYIQKKRSDTKNIFVPSELNFVHYEHNDVLKQLLNSSLKQNFSSSNIFKSQEVHYYLSEERPSNLQESKTVFSLSLEKAVNREAVPSRTSKAFSSALNSTSPTFLSRKRVSRDAGLSHFSSSGIR